MDDVGLTDVIGIRDDKHLTDASRYEWTTRSGQTIALGEMGSTHLRNLLRHLHRQTLKYLDAQEQFFLDQIDPNVPSSFSGLEDRLEFFEEARKNVLLEMRRRMRELKAKGNPGQPDPTKGKEDDR